MEQTTRSNLTLNNRTELILTGIKKVKSTDPTVVTAILDSGAVIINGANLSIQRLDIKEGILELQGMVNALKYSNQVSKSFSFKNMFK
jgi:sporulation protein YabP